MATPPGIKPKPLITRFFFCFFSLWAPLCTALMATLPGIRNTRLILVVGFHLILLLCAALMATLPAIDANDEPKSLAAFRFYCCVLGSIGQLPVGWGRSHSRVHVRRVRAGEMCGACMHALGGGVFFPPAKVPTWALMLGSCRSPPSRRCPSRCLPRSRPQLCIQC